LSAGASAPEILVDEIIDAFRERYDVSLHLAATATETEELPVMRALRDVELTPADMAFVNGVRGARPSTPTFPIPNWRGSWATIRSATYFPIRASRKVSRIRTSCFIRRAAHTY